MIIGVRNDKFTRMYGMEIGVARVLAEGDGFKSRSLVSKCSSFFGSAHHLSNFRESTPAERCRAGKRQSPGTRTWYLQWSWSGGREINSVYVQSDERRGLPAKG